MILFLLQLSCELCYCCVVLGECCCGCLYLAFYSCCCEFFKSCFTRELEFDEWVDDGFDEPIADDNDEWWRDDFLDEFEARLQRGIEASLGEDNPYSHGGQHSSAAAEEDSARVDPAESPAESNWFFIRRVVGTFLGRNLEQGSGDEGTREGNEKLRVLTENSRKRRVPRNVKFVCEICFEDALPTSPDSPDVPCSIFDVRLEEETNDGALTPQELGSLSELRCGHAFHTTCLERWALASPTYRDLTCPKCRQPITEGSNYKDRIFGWEESKMISRAKSLRDSVRGRIREVHRRSTSGSALASPAIPMSHSHGRTPLSPSPPAPTPSVTPPPMPMEISASGTRIPAFGFDDASFIPYAEPAPPRSIPPSVPPPSTSFPRVERRHRPPPSSDIIPDIVAHPVEVGDREESSNTTTTTNALPPGLETALNRGLHVLDVLTGRHRGNIVRAADERVQRVAVERELIEVREAQRERERERQDEELRTVSNQSAVSVAPPLPEPGPELVSVPVPEAESEPESEPVPEAESLPEPDVILVNPSSSVSRDRRERAVHRLKKRRLRERQRRRNHHRRVL